MKKVNVRRELLSLLRGFFATPIITALSKNGIIEKILKKKKLLYQILKKLIIILNLLRVYSIIYHP